MHYISIYYRNRKTKLNYFKENFIIKLISNYFYYSGVSPSPNTGVSIPKPLDSTIRARRLMKEYKEIQKIQTARPDPIFTVS